MIVKRLKRFPFFDHRYRIAVGRLDIQFRINIDGGKILDTACLCQNGWDIVIEVSKKPSRVPGFNSIVARTLITVHSPVLTSEQRAQR